MSRGSNKILRKYALSELEEEYVLIYHEYFVLKYQWHELCSKHKCTKEKIQTALHWVIDNKLKIPSPSLIKGAIDALESRIRINTALYNKEVKKQRHQDKSFIVALTKELREDEKTVFKLQEIYSDPEDPETANLTPSQVLSLIKENSKTKPFNDKQ